MNVLWWRRNRNMDDSKTNAVEEPNRNNHIEIISQDSPNNRPVKWIKCDSVGVEI